VLHRAEQFKSITYIGDGPWDIAAVASLEWSFIGVASHYSSETLRGWGAEAVVSDYLVLEDFLAH
jgi:phosphoglycolate phosphatase-like HAD superfamily hydrolase